MKNSKAKNIFLCYCFLLSICLKYASGLSKNKNTNVDISSVTEDKNENLVDKR